MAAKLGKNEAKRLAAAARKELDDEVDEGVEVGEECNGRPRTAQ